MNIADALAAVKFVMECGEVPMLVGEAGVGKTQLIEEIGAQTGRHVIKLMLSQMEPGDLIGLPVRDEANNKTRYLAPDWFPTRSDVILFLDEINRAHITVRSAIMQLLIDRRLHEHKLPDGVWLCAAMNPDTPDYEVEAIIDKAFIDRFVWIKVTNNVNSWREYN
ncbi:MAG: MoxR family ATPase, partial [Pseudothermotoga sp.]|nr:MoxR family ATPase [Pseudothermotoga sp.]